MLSCVVQDDYIDCFGDPSLTGKVGTDIEDNKCSWLIVQALSRASNEQRSVLEVRLIALTVIVTKFESFVNFAINKYQSPL